MTIVPCTLSGTDHVKGIFSGFSELCQLAAGLVPVRTFPASWFKSKTKKFATEGTEKRFNTLEAKPQTKFDRIKFERVFFYAVIPACFWRESIYRQREGTGFPPQARENGGVVCVYVSEK